MWSAGPCNEAYPNGVEGDFFTRSASRTRTGLARDGAHPLRGSGRTADFPVVTDAAGLAWIVNLGCIELHTWHARVTDVERPDYMLIDLDPSEGNPWKLVPEIAWWSKRSSTSSTCLASRRPPARPASTSSRPSKPELRFPEVRRFAKALGAGGRAASRPGRGHDDLEGGRATRRLRRLRPERPRPHDRVRLLDPPDVGRARLGAASLGGGRRASTLPRSRSQTMRDRVAEVGDLTKGMWRRKVEPCPPGLRLSRAESATN